MEKFSKIMFHVFITGMFIIIIFCYIFSNGTISSISDEDSSQVIQPISVKVVDEDTSIYTFDVSNDTNISKTLRFYSNHQLVKAYVGKECIYSIEPDSESIGTTGSIMNFIKLPTNATTLKVEITAINPKVRNLKYTFYYGDAFRMYNDVMHDSIISAIISLFDFFIGFMLIFYWIIFRKGLKKTAPFYLGMVAMGIGLWSLFDTDFIKVFAMKSGVSSILSYLFLMVVSIPFILYSKSSLDLKDKYLSYIFCGYSFIQSVVCTILHFTGILQYKETVIFTHISLVIAISYLMWGIIYHIKNYGIDRKIKIQCVALIAIFLAFLLDIAAFYLNQYNVDSLGRFGILVYLFMMSNDSIYDFSNQLKEGHKSDLYKEMASMDMMTSVKNRTAYELWQQDHEDLHNTFVAMFDLNDLKWTNDNLGHAAGDRYLIDAADIIKSIFPKEAVIYRIGGDEFCTIVNSPLHIKDTIIENRLIRAERLYNEAAPGMKMEIAYGFANFNKADGDIQNTIKRADERMYRCKRQQKEKRNNA